MYITMKSTKDLKIEELNKLLNKLKEENIALKKQIALLYNNWNYDYARFTELKEKCQNK